MQKLNLTAGVDSGDSGPVGGAKINLNFNEFARILFGQEIWQNGVTQDLIESLLALPTNNKTSFLAAIVEMYVAGNVIDDTLTSSLLKTWSIDKLLATFATSGVSERYADISELISDQSNQINKQIFFVSDASADPLVASGYAYYEFINIGLATISDYRIISVEESVSPREYHLLLQTSSTASNWQLRTLAVKSATKFFIIDNSTGFMLHSGSTTGTISADLSTSSGGCSVYIEIDATGNGIDELRSFYGVGKITYLNLTILPLLEKLIINNTGATASTTFSGSSPNLQEINLYAGSYVGLDLSQNTLIEHILIYGGATFDTEIDVRLNTLLKTYSCPYSSLFDAGNHLLIEYLVLIDTISTTLQASINTVTLPNLKYLNLWGCNYYDLDFSTRDLSGLESLYLKANSIISINQLSFLKNLYLYDRSLSLNLTGMILETLEVRETNATTISLTALTTLTFFSLKYQAHPNLSSIFINNGQNGSVVRFERLYITNAYGVIDVTVDDSVAANAQTSPYLPTVWKKDYAGYQVLNFI